MSPVPPPPPGKNKPKKAPKPPAPPKINLMPVINEPDPVSETTERQEEQSNVP